MHNNLIRRNNINIFGNGTQAIVFAHGFGCDQNMWRHITPAFEKEYQVILYDHVGSGKSDQSAYDFEKYSSLHGYADDLIEICNDLHLQKVIFVGHSVSSMIGILASTKRPDLFEKLVLIGPSPCYVNKNGYVGGFTSQDIDELIETLESNYLGWSSYITPVIIGNPEMPEYSEELRNSFCNMNPEIAKHFAKVTFLGDNREDLQKVTIPTLIIQCHPDVIAPVVVGEFVHKEIPNSRYVLLNSSGHCPHLTSPDQVISSIHTFLTTDN
ncbi:alpha/beta fold hydrolase [Lunatibacter salilacus]|uniref:alpha/beta fold hydrolase n=1 Tax=Lunatibacter salilacus TaxID=2483804 RepID=UPI00131ACA30|nr:alpha/beta hydrolase [Lunatibacter salilacus]